MKALKYAVLALVAIGCAAQDAPKHDVGGASDHEVIEWKFMPHKVPLYMKFMVSNKMECDLNDTSFSHCVLLEGATIDDVMTDMYQSLLREGEIRRDEQVEANKRVQTVIDIAQRCINASLPKASKHGTR